MDKRKILFTILVIILIVIIGGLTYIKLNSKNENIETEITPLEEITEEQERETIISLYFVNSETNTLVPEARKIDAKELVENPYKTLVELLIEGPKNEKLISNIPKEVRINNVVFQNGVVEIDLSKEFIENQQGDKVQIELEIYSIVNTLTELNEVNCVKILIEGEENKKFNDVDIDLSKTFTRQD